ncbi:MAG TPA: tRNA lysidine(34) synthetase TilS [Candidatus Brocadiales bacterium]|nr:tRNA lysidine(34) synthetase TilS [Candidatus Brocadiales bacterium]
MKHDKLKFQVAKTIKECELLKSGETVIVGVSGGADSVALLSLLLSIVVGAGLKPAPTYYIAHLNHKLRGKESDEDEAFVRSLAERFDIGIEVKSVDIKALTSIGRHSIEEVARKERYAFFESVARKVGASSIAVGHTADDNAETILHRIIRGTGLFGLQGMRPKRPLFTGSSIQLIRPLIFSWREDIIKYLEQEGLPFRIDSSNLQVDYFRNMIRLELLPLLSQKYNKNIKEALCRLGEIAQQDYDFLSVKLNDVLDSTLDSRLSTLSSIVLDASVLAKQPQILKQLAIRECLVRLGVSLKSIGYKNYTAISKLLGWHGQTCLSVPSLQLSNGLTVKLEQGKLYLEKDAGRTDIPVCPPDRVEINFPGTTDLPSFGFQVTAETFENKEGFLNDFKQHKTEYEEVFDLDKIEGSLYVRTRRAGDRFHPLGSKGIKKLKDFFIDEKVPYLMRSRIPIVTMNDQPLIKTFRDKPIWVVGMRIDDRVKLNKGTKNVLKIVFKKDDR